jgi:hypothetical protein
MGGFHLDVKFEYEVHQVGPKNHGSQNFSFLAYKEEAVGVVQIFANDGNGNGAWQTEFFYSSNQFFCHKY